MKKLGLIIIALALLLTTACEYRLLESKDGASYILAPDGTKYYYFSGGFFSADINDYRRDTPVATLTEQIGDSTVIYNLHEVVGSDGNVLAIEDTSYVIREVLPLYVKEGYEMPTLDDTDKIESVYYFKYYEAGHPGVSNFGGNEFLQTAYVDESSDWIVSGYDLEYIERYKMDVDPTELWDMILEYEIFESKEDVETDIVGKIKLRFKELDTLYFGLSVASSEESQFYYINTALFGESRTFAVPKSSFDEYFGMSIPPKEIYNLVDGDRAYSKYTLYDSSSLELDLSASDESGKYFKVTNEAYDTWEEWTEFAKSVYCDGLLDSRLDGNEAVINVDGYTYAAESSVEDSISEFYTYKIISESEEEIVILVSYVYVGADDYDDPYSVAYELTLTPDGWRMSDMAQTDPQKLYTESVIFG